jgi:peptidoglycan/LPS O-acetylase OafA/YrhL
VVKLASIATNSEQKNTIAVLDGVRGIACLLVILYHVNIQARFIDIWSPDIHPVITSFGLMGWSGVTLFFILSGFLLFMPYVRALLAGGEWPSTRSFYLRRALRILPAYYVSLLLILFFIHPDYLQPQRWRELLLFFSLLMDSDTATFQKINGPYWTLAIEWQFYMLLPFIGLGLRWLLNRFEQRRRVFVLSLFLVAMLGWGLFSRYWGMYFFAHPQASILLPRTVFNYVLFFLYGVGGKFAEDFAIGMMVSTCYVLSHNAAENPHLNLRMRRISPWLWSLGIAVLLFMILWPVFPALSFLHPYIARSQWLCEVGFAAGYGLCMAALLFSIPGIKRLFEWQPLRWTGLLSYSLYIWHLPFLLILSDHIIPTIKNWHGGVIYGLYWCVLALVVLPFCYAFYRFIELPWMRKRSTLRLKTRLQEESKIPQETLQPVSGEREVVSARR